MDIKDFKDQLTDLTPEKRKLFAELLERKQNLKRTHDAQKNFLSFVKFMWPDFVEGTHHRIIAEKFDRIADGTLKRLIVNMPPRHTKSEFASFMLPAFIMGRNPMTKIIQTSHTAELSQRFGRKTKQLIDSSDYKKIFPETALQADSKAAGRWDTSAGGEYFAAGVGGAITGRGADLLIIDDPHSEQDALSETAMENAYEWYTSGPRQRLQPGGAIVLVMTRWSTIDLTGNLMKAQVEPKADQWEVVEFPAIMDSGLPTWPEYWKLQELESVKASLAITKWNAQWMQRPTSEEGAILKREWWKPWAEKDTPNLHYIIQSYDTAFSKKETADYSAITTWGVFSPDDARPALILYGENDDYVDTVTQALMRFRQSGLIQLRMDYEPEPLAQTKRVFY